MTKPPTAPQITIDLSYLITSTGVVDEDEVAQIVAYLELRSFNAAAQRTGRNRHTVSRTWDRFLDTLKRSAIPILDHRDACDPDAIPRISDPSARGASGS